MKSQIIASMSSFILGTGATLVALASWTGTSNLNDIKQAVQQYTVKADEQVSALLGEYNVTVDQANAEIEDYQQALEQANDNISQLITAYEQAEEEHEIELKSQQASAEQDLADLQQAYDEMVARVNSDYESNMNEVIEQANAEINQANAEVEQTVVDVAMSLNNSGISQYTIEDHKEHMNQLDTTGSKEVTDISSIVPSEQQGE